MDIVLLSIFTAVCYFIWIGCRFCYRTHIALFLFALLLTLVFVIKAKWLVREIRRELRHEMRLLCFHIYGTSVFEQEFNEAMLKVLYHHFKTPPSYKYFYLICVSDKAKAVQDIYNLIYDAPDDQPISLFYLYARLIRGLNQLDDNYFFYYIEADNSEYAIACFCGISLTPTLEYIKPIPRKIKLNFNGFDQLSLAAYIANREATLYKIMTAEIAMYDPQKKEKYSNFD